MRTLTMLALAAPLSAGLALEASAQILIPAQQHETLDVELVSLSDEITLYMGDPQELLRMTIHPARVEPRVEYSSQAQAFLRIRDAYLFQTSREGEPSEEELEKNPPNQERWEMRLYPTGPTKFVLNCEGGHGDFDFTDFQVQDVHIEGGGSKFEVEFSRQNPMEMESFEANVSKGSLAFRGMLNARAKHIALFVPESACDLELTGKEFEGESAIALQGVPSSVRLVVSKKVGVRVGGPAQTIARFQAPHMSHAGEEWVSRDYDKAKCRVRITFSEEVPGLEIGWK